MIFPLVLTACEESIGPIEAPILVDVGEELTNLCQKPIRLPRRPLTQAEVEHFWIQDRTNLENCGITHEALVEFIRQRDNRIRDG